MIMKADELKLEDVMCGDWVDVRNDASPNTPHLERITPSHFLRDEHWYGVELASEILEKNGFKPYIPENHLETIYACQDISKAVADELYALWPCRDDSFYLLLRVGGKDMVRMNVRYVHQLQHALRLAGIEKEIAL